MRSAPHPGGPVRQDPGRAHGGGEAALGELLGRAAGSGPRAVTAALRRFGALCAVLVLLSVGGPVRAAAPEPDEDPGADVTLVLGAPERATMTAGLPGPGGADEHGFLTSSAERQTVCLLRRGPTLPPPADEPEPVPGRASEPDQPELAPTVRRVPQLGP